MIPGDTIRLGLRNLSEARVRTILTTLGVAIGIGSLTAMVSLGVGLQEQLVGRFARSGLFDMITVSSAQAPFGPGRRAARGPRKGAAPDSPGTAAAPRAILDDAVIAKLARLDRVREVYPNLRIPVEVRYGEVTEFATVHGVPMSARSEGVFRAMAHGSFFPDETSDTCIVSRDFAKRLNEADPGTIVGRSITLAYATAGSGGTAIPGLPAVPGLNLQRAERQFTVVGIVDREPGPSAMLGLMSGILLPLNKARQLSAYDLGDPQSLLRRLSSQSSYGTVTVRVERPQDTDEVEQKIREMGFSAFSINDALEGARKAFILVDILLGLTGSVALTVALLGIANTMVMSILERTREIGIMKAVGGDDADIRGIFLCEASLIGTIGGLAGILLGWTVAQLINIGANFYIRSQGGSPEQVFSFPWWLMTGAVAFSVVTSLLAGLVPASRAARLDPIQALRHD